MMFVHMFNNVYFVNKSSDPEKKIYGYITFDTIDDYNELKKDYRALENMYNSLSVKARISNRHNGVHIFLLSDNDFIKAISDYCSLLKLDHGAINKMIEHSDNCELYMESCDDISKYNKNVLFHEGNFSIRDSDIQLRSLDIYPPELFINCLDNSTAIKKFTKLRLAELYELVKNLQYKCLRENLEFFEELRLFVYNTESMLLLYNPDIFENMINLLNNLGMDTTKFTCPLEEYFDMDPTFGYNQYNIFKYNYPLAKYLKKTGYKIV